MGGMLGRLFREFAVVLSTAILISLVISLTTTPMMCARVLKNESEYVPGRLYRASEAAFEWLLARYRGSLAWALRHWVVMLVVTFATVVLNVYLFIDHPQGFFPGSGHRPSHRLDRGCAGHLVPGNERQAQPTDGDRADRSCGGERARLLRRCRQRHHAQHRPRVHFAQTARRARRECNASHQPAARQALACSRCDALSAAGSGCAHRRPAQQCAVSVHAGRRELEGIVRMVAQASCRSCARCRSSPT